MVFLCDEYVVLRDVSRLRAKKMILAWRFFDIGRRLPLDLQMLLCNRAAQQATTVTGILMKDSEPAFHAVATLLNSPS